MSADISKLTMRPKKYFILPVLISRKCGQTDAEHGAKFTPGLKFFRKKSALTADIHDQYIFCFLPLEDVYTKFERAEFIIFK